MATTVVSNKRYLISGAAIAVVAIAAYGLGRVYPPLGPSAGTVTPADRYVSAQIGDDDVTLGDTAVPELMQTDAFELIIKDPNFRALAASPGFQALAGQPQVMAALLANPKAFAALASNPSAFAGVAKASEALAAASGQSKAHNAQVLATVSGHSAALEALAGHP
ncbi:MAG TPA: hypothetical protein VFR60_01135, partial [Sphingomicrobium sp.]|nr:hypothetical protein [Sphingomicrobium sp.]